MITPPLPVPEAELARLFKKQLGDKERKYKKKLRCKDDAHELELEEVVLKANLNKQSDIELYQDLQVRNCQLEKELATERLRAEVTRRLLDDLREELATAKQETDCLKYILHRLMNNQTVSIYKVKS